MKKLLSMILVIAVVFSVFASSILINADENNIGSEEQEKKRNQLSVSEQLEQMAQEYTDRYIVKFSGDISNAVDYACEESKKAKQEKIDTIKESNEEEFFKIMKKDEEIIVSENVHNLLDGLNSNDISAHSDTISYKIDQEKSVIILSDKLNPDLFLEKIYEKANGNIQYIQKDYKLELSDINEKEKDELVLNGDTASNSNENKFLTDKDKEETNDEINQNEPSQEVSVDLEVIENPVQTDVIENPNSNTAEPEIIENQEMEDFDTGLVNDLHSDIQSAWKKTKGAGVRIAVIDSKIDITHPDLTSHIVNGFDIVKNSELTYDENIKGQYYHGTHVTGIIASTVPEAEIIPIAAFGDGQAYTSDLIKAIEYAKEQGATIVNCSFGSVDNNQALKEAMKDSGMIFVCAAGNNRANIDKTPVYPACFDIENVISVTSLNEDLGFSYYSNYGTNVDIAMYGRNVRSVLPGGDYGEQSGTSMSAAYVTAGAAMAESIGATNIKETLLDGSVRLSNLKGKVNDCRKLSYSNIVNNVISNDIIEVSPEDDFDFNGYQRTPEENWELFSSLEIVQIEAGGNNTAFIMNDGSLWMSGDNTYGQLGNNTLEKSDIPVKVIGLYNIVQVAVGENHCIALNSGGNAYMWGNNSYHAVSFSDNSKISFPVSHTLSNIIYVEAGSQTSFVVKRFDGVFAQGNNAYGQLGNGTRDTVGVLTQMENSIGAHMVKSYNKHTFFIAGATVYACGSNDHGVLGLNYSGTTITPVTISISADIDTGNNHAVAIDETGTVKTWGTNDWGQCGKGEDGKGYLNIHNAKSVKCGKEHSVILLEDGTVMTWGYNLRGQIGDGTHNKRYEPYVVKNLPEIIQIAAGKNHTVALDKDGKIWRWGDNTYGQFGNGSTVSSNDPRQGFYGEIVHKKISSGSNHILYIDEDGKLLVKGDNTYGQLGTGDNNERGDFTELPGPWGDKKIVKVETCADTSFVLTEDCKLYGWGRNDKSQLHNNSNIDKNIPQYILAGIIDIAAGREHIISLDSDGDVCAWGDNTYGQIILNINGGGVNRLFTNARGIAAGDYQSFIIDENSNLYALGKNDRGQLGLLDTENKNQPKFVIDNVKNVSAGYNHTAILTNRGELFVCGDNTYGQLGVTLSNDETYTSNPTNTKIYVDEIAAGANSTAYVKNNKVYQCGSVANQQNNSFHNIEGLDNISEISIRETCIAINEDRELFCWGIMTTGKFNTSNRMTSPTKVEYPYAIRQVDSFSSQSLAINSLGQVIAWGQGYYGNGSDKMETKTYPTVIEGIKNPIQVSRGKNHSLVLDKDGNVWGWGSNTDYPMGIFGGKVKVPSILLEISNVKQIAAGTGFSVFLKNDGTLWGLGKNDKGQIKHGEIESIYSPVQITDKNNFKMVSVGETHVMALADDGVYTWGENTYGQLGNGSTDSCDTPVKLNLNLESGEYVTKISAGKHFCLCLTNIGNVYSWGHNGSGRLGLGDKKDRYSPVKIVNLSNIISIDAGNSHAMAIKKDGTVYGWGYSTDGQLGFDLIGSTLIPQISDRLNNKNINQISCGYSSTFAINRKGQLYAFGSNVSGQLGIMSVIPQKLQLTQLIENNVTKSVDIVSGQEYIFIINVKNVVDFSDLEIGFEYDAAKFELIDAVSQTYLKDITIGNLMGSNIVVSECSQGIIKYRKMLDIGTGNAYSGFFNGVKLKAKSDGSTEVKLINN